MIASPEMQKYFKEIECDVSQLYSIASAARAKNMDPCNKVEISLARNMAERVVGLISVVAPQLAATGVVDRIVEFEKKYGALDWRVALKIAEEIALEKFCKFKDKKEAIEVGIRTGFAYSTMGVVSSPLDGFIGIDIKKRLDGKGEYLCLNYGGPIRNAGGTNASVSVLIADYIRKKMGYAVYDPAPEEIKRAITELQDYHERVTPLQYKPSEAETSFMVANLPVEISGDPSEQIEVSNYKDLPRVPTNMIRSGYCLVLSSCLQLKAPKLWKQLSLWGKDFEMDHWNFLEEYIKIQKAEHAKGSGSAEKGKAQKLSPDYTYIQDLVAGRPVFAHPLRTGGFRLRYGRSRTSGYSSCAIHPATMVLSNNYLATGTQLKLERPMKGTAITACDTIDGPIVKLEDGSVVFVETAKQAKEVLPKLKEILFLGDLLINYGDFFNRAHPLVPAGYCPEWWAQELERTIVEMFGVLDFDKLGQLVGISGEEIEVLVKNPLRARPDSRAVVAVSRKTKQPLHPRFSYYWSTIESAQFVSLVLWLLEGQLKKTDSGEIEKIVLQKKEAPKRVLELIGVPHIVVNNEFVVVEKDHAYALAASVGLDIKTKSQIAEELSLLKDVPPLDAIQKLGQMRQRDKAGTFIGARMGRPEKAKMRKLTGSPQVLFPVGEEGGKMRCFQSALEAGKVTAEFATYLCKKCNSEQLYPSCDVCGATTQRTWHCNTCGTIETPACSHGPAKPFKELTLDIKREFESALKKLGMTVYPELIKGIRGTSNKEHIPEHLAKGILRAKHGIYIFKDGTTRYDMTQLPMTHFRPKEIRTEVSVLKKLGYLKDIYGMPLERDDQILELKPQDIVLPDSDESPDEGAAGVLKRVADFIDDELVCFYGLKPYYSVDSPEKLVGHLVLCLAPHTSAGIVGRIIGFSKTQAFFAHPLLHAATRRDCDGDEACVILLLDAFLNFSRKYLPESRGSTMDAPLVLTSVLAPNEVDDMAFDMDIVSYYPLDFYESALAFKMPWEVKIRQIKGVLGTEQQYEGVLFTHDFESINNTVQCSAYKTLPSMEDKLKGQMNLAEKIRAVDAPDVARLVIEKHFLRDTKGNLRKFSMQEFRCVNCNEKYRRPPLVGKCTACNGKIIFTISEGSIIKYLEPTISLAKKYEVSPYLKQSIELLQKRIEGIFGKEKERQTGLGAWFG